MSDTLKSMRDRLIEMWAPFLKADSERHRGAYLRSYIETCRTRSRSYAAKKGAAKNRHQRSAFTRWQGVWTARMMAAQERLSEWKAERRGSGDEQPGTTNEFSVMDVQWDRTVILQSDES